MSIADLDFLALAQEWHVMHRQEQAAWRLYFKAIDYSKEEAEYKKIWADHKNKLTAWYAKIGLPQENFIKILLELELVTHEVIMNSNLRDITFL